MVRAESESSGEHPGPPVQRRTQPWIGQRSPSLFAPTLGTRTTPRPSFPERWVSRPRTRLVGDASFQESSPEKETDHPLPPASARESSDRRGASIKPSCPRAEL